MAQRCSQCGTPLSQYNPGTLCFSCQKKRSEERLSQHEASHYTAEDMATILGLQSQESVKRLGRKGKLPARIPGVKKWLWHKQDIDRWISSGHRLGDEALQAIEVEKHYSELHQVHEKVLSNARKLSGYRNAELKHCPNLIEGGIINDGRYDWKGKGPPPVPLSHDYVEPVGDEYLAEAHLRHFKQQFPQFSLLNWNDVTNRNATNELLRALEIFGHAPFVYGDNCSICQAIVTRVPQN